MNSMGNNGVLITCLVDMPQANTIIVMISDTTTNYYGKPTKRYDNKAPKIARILFK